MRVKVGNKWYDGKKEMIMVELEEKDKENIAYMHFDCTKYCEFPPDTKGDIREKFMEIKKEE